MRRIAFLALLLATVACKRQASPTVFVDPALATLVPRETRFLAGIRMQQLTATPFYSKWGSRIAYFDRFQRDTGLDGRRMWEFLIASDGQDTVSLVRGEFAERGFEPRLDRPGAQRFSYKSYIFIGDEHSAVVFLNPSTAAAGSTAALRRVVDSRNDPAGLPPALQERISHIPARHQVWFASAGLAGPLALPPGFEFASGGLDLRSAIRAELTLEYPSEAAAREARLPELFPTPGTRSGRVVRFSTQRPEDVLDISTPWRELLLGVK